MADGDVLQIVDGHQAFAPGGAVQRVSLSSADVDLTTPNFLDPAGAAATLIPVVAGTVVLAWFEPTATFDHAGVLDLWVLDTDGVNGTSIAEYQDVAAETTPIASVENFALAISAATSTFGDPGNRPRWAHILASGFIGASFASDGTAPTVGAGTVYALIATPS